MHEEWAGLVKGTVTATASFVALLAAGVDEKAFAGVVSVFLGLVLWNVRQVLDGLKSTNRKMDSMYKKLVAVQHAVAAIIISDERAREAVERTSGEHLHDLLSPSSGEHEARES